MIKITNGEKIQQDFECEVCEPIPEDDIIHVIFADKKDSAIGFDLSWWNTEYKEPTTQNDLALIHTEGLDEEIRCTMCTNYMKSDRGCDGSCVVDKDMYKAVMDAIEKRIQPTTKNDLGVDCVARQDVERFIEGFINEYTPEEELEFINLELDGLKHIPSVTPQEPTDKNFTKADIDAIVKAINEGWELRVNEVLDKIKAEIEQLRLHKAEFLTNDNKVCIDSQAVLDIIDKYKAEGSKDT